MALNPSPPTAPASNDATSQNGVRYLGQIVTALTTLASNLSTAFARVGGTSGSAVGGAATLPANPVGFVTITLANGTSVKVPYYT